MAENNSILDKLEGLVSRYEEVGTLITDPNVISDQKRYVKLTKEYKDLGDIMKARKEYMDSLQTLQDAKDILTTEDDPEMKEMAREELAAAEKHIPEMEDASSCSSSRPTRKTTKTSLWKYGEEREETKLHCSQAICSACTPNIAK